MWNKQQQRQKLLSIKKKRERERERDVRDMPIFPLITLERDLYLRNVFGSGALWEFFTFYNSIQRTSRVKLSPQPLFGKFFEDCVNTDVAGLGFFFCLGEGDGGQGINKLRVQSDGGSIALFLKWAKNKTQLAVGHLLWVKGWTLWDISQKTLFPIKITSYAYNHLNNNIKMTLM